MELFKLLGTIAINNSEAKKALKETSAAAKDTAEDVKNTSTSTEKSSSKWGSAFQKIGSGALALGKTVAVGIGAATTAIGGLTVKALSSAGELEQNMGGSEAVFGKFATKIQETAKTAFSNMGLSTSDYLATANKMGALFQGAGFDIEKSMTMSQDAMQRAADVASIMGIDTASAMEAVAGAAKGNFTMMDNLGVAMNETTLANYALEKGMAKSYDQMTQQEKIGVAMEMFMDKTAYAAENYAKENETLAGSLGTAKAALSNFLSGAGSVEDVVSSFSNFANVIVKNINSMFPALMSGITKLVDQLVPMIPPLLQQVLPGLIQGATSLINGLVAAMPAVVQALLAAVPALIQGVTQIIQSLVAALPTIFQVLVEALPSIIEMICAALPSLLPAIINALVAMIVTLCSNLAQIIQPIIDYLPSIIISIVNALMENLPALIDGAIALVMGIVEAAPQIIKALVDVMPQVIAMVVTGILNSLPQLIMGFIKLFAGVVAALPQILSSLIKALPNAFKGIWNGIKNVFSPLGGWFKSKFSEGAENAKKAWSTIKSFFSNIKDGIVNAFANIKEKLTAPFTKARDTIKGIADKIKGFFKGEISMPKIKMPHFSVSPSGWKIGDLLKGSIPKLGIEWYAEAMNNPIVMKEPTIFGYNSKTGQLMGGGEAGSEVVTGTNTLMNMIQGAVSAQNSGLVYYLNKIIEMLAMYFPQILEKMDIPVPAVIDPNQAAAALAVPINKELGKLSTREERGR